MKRVAVKLGTRVLTQDDGALAHDRLAEIVGRVADLVKQGREVMMVSSGAVGLSCSAVPKRKSTRANQTFFDESRIRLSSNRMCCCKVGLLSN